MPDDVRPAADELDRWQRVLETIADRERAERGVDEAVSVVRGRGMIYGRFGELQIAIGGDHGFADEDALFRHIDWWIAFERDGGVLHLLPRDREFVAERLAGLPREQVMWRQAAGRVLADVARTTSLRWDWRVTLRASLPDPSQPSPPGLGTGIAVGPGTASAPQRHLSVPELRLEGNAWDMGLPDDVTNLADATAYLAEAAQERIIEETHQPWPRCPDHDHPLSVSRANAAAWICPASHEIVAEVGELPAST